MLGVAALLALATQGAHAQVDLDAYIKRDAFVSIKLSPTGEFLAATVPMEDRTALAILRRSDNKVTAHLAFTSNTHVSDVEWVNDDRVILGVEEKFGQLDEPQSTGELYGINADGSGSGLLLGQRVAGGGLGTRIKGKKAERIAGALTDSLKDDARNVIVSVSPLGVEAPFTSAERMDVYTGRRILLTKAPVRRASFFTDNAGEVRFASGAASNNVNQLYYRDGGDWRLLNDEGVTGHIETPLGFSPDNAIAYLQVEQASGPDAVVAWDTRSGERREMLRDAVADPLRILYRNGSRVPVGAMVMGGKPKTLFFEESSEESRLYHSLEAAFPESSVFVTSSTSDGSQLLVQTQSDRSPGDFYLFDTAKKKAEFLFARRQWFDPAKMAAAMPITLNARDGVELHGYLTRPDNAKGLVVMPHGGPFGVHDDWFFDTDTQMLADAGYAVLRLNFRGSGNYGRAFRHAGGRQWGRAMQDDVTDATRWALAQGVAKADKVCIYGASYGAYAAMMGAAKEPGLYRCAAGYVGVYDLAMMFNRGDISDRRSGEVYLREWLGAPGTLAEVSPVNLADRIKIPVFLAAGGEDERAPIQHTEKMEAELKRAGAPVNVLYYPTEGHGFYMDAHRREYYTRLLDFFAANLGGARAKTGQ
jgi:dipeptidyl aminopeptidase/acylaminoacyl peptidase